MIIMIKKIMIKIMMIIRAIKAIIIKAVILTAKTKAVLSYAGQMPMRKNTISTVCLRIFPNR